MMRFAVTFAVLVALLFGGAYAGGLFANEKKDEPKPKGMLPPNWGKLGLSEVQKEKIYTIQAGYKAQIEELNKKIEELKKKERSEMVEVLTPEQKKKLQELTTGSGEKPEKPEKPEK